MKSQPLTTEQTRLLNGLESDWKGLMVDMLTKYQSLMFGVTSRAKDPVTLKNAKEARKKSEEIYAELANMKTVLMKQGFTEQQAKKAVDDIYDAASDDARAATFHKDVEYSAPLPQNRGRSD